jgi:uncharacterized membrane protein YfcA
MIILLCAFAITIISTIISVSGGNGIILMPSLMMLHYDIKEIMYVIRISAIILVLFNLLALLHARKVPKFTSNDFWITVISCLSVYLSIAMLTILNNTYLMVFIAMALAVLFFLVIYKPNAGHFSLLWILILPIFAGICGSMVGGAGLIISILYTLLGADHTMAVQKRIIPSLVIQIFACFAFSTQNFPLNSKLLIIVLVATAIGGYINMKIFLKLSKRTGKAVFYSSFFFSITNLFKNALEHIH